MIKDLAEQLFTEERMAIDEIDNSSNQSMTGQRKAKVETTSSYLTQLKERVLDYSFASKEEEIGFFKLTKPKFSSLLIFYSNIERIELDKPEGGLSHLKGYYENELKTIKRFFEANRQIYSYYRSEADYLDNKLFLRGVLDPPRWLCKIRVDQDERFSTAGDYMFARIMATQQIARYLENSITGLDFHPFTENDIETNWTGESINLLEVAYGVYCTSQVNHGKIGIAELVRKFEKVFNINMGRPYRRFLEIKQRKRLSRTKYIEDMAKSINKKIDDEDAFNPNDIKNPVQNG
ncbi:MAG: RteC domain-containing protein [Candidatus Pedobacter colombiensis]|uniref:RteC domain-containing protein n=1 Tax=Candidatus Pedobacter colombiensis TaxID=3121371 RepID=A0AAJ6B5J6_9SPHI|nr:RteC domain-containing protein [Pedobacter sp.]WEK17869.1 MAG: RteC domain-containing protein [Pedobacter sp.]